MSNSILKLPLQYFAEEETISSANTETEGGEETQELTPPNSGENNPDLQEPKSLTQADVDKAVEARLKRERQKHQKELAEKLSEAGKLAKMTADQKAKFEAEKKEKELQEREAKVTAMELKAQAKDTLASKKLPIQLADILDYTSAESCNTSIEAVEKAFETAVTQAVNDRLRGNPPKAGDTNNNNVKDEFLEGFNSV